MKKQELLAALETALSNGFETMSVKKIIENVQMLEESATPVVTEEGTMRLVEIITRKVSDVLDRANLMDLIDYSSADFSLSGNEICLESVDFDLSPLEDELSTSIENAVLDYFPASEE